MWVGFDRSKTCITSVTLCKLAHFTQKVNFGDCEKVLHFGQLSICEQNQNIKNLFVQEFQRKVKPASS